MVAKQAQLAAGRAGRVVFDGSAVDVSDFLADGGAGNRDTEFDGSADGIGDEVGSLQYGSCGGRGRCREPSSSQHRTLYILCLTRSPVDRLMHSRSGRAALVDVPVAVIHSEPEQCPPASVTSNGCVGLLRLRLFIDIFSYCAAALDFRSMAPRS